MKIYLILIIVSVCNLQASNIFSQNKKISLDMQNVSVREIIQELETHGGVNFLFNDNLAGLDRQVSVSYIDHPIKYVLKDALSQANMEYEEFRDNFIVLLPSSENRSQLQRQISGMVRDSQGELLPGVSVSVQGTTIGTITDVNGSFRLDIPEDAGILVFSFVGMVRQEVIIGEQRVFEITMQDEQIGLDEVVVIGYGTQRRLNLTGSVDVVSAEVIANRTATNMSFLMQGTAPNLQFSIDPRGGGEPGSSGSFNIRGMGSIRGNDRPLILVDGVEMNMNDINPEDVESITVLKDASASAVYGARAPFGVVLITTKRGIIGRPVINYSSNVTAKNWHKRHDQVDALTWATAYNQAATNTGASPLYPEEQMQRIRGYLDGTYPYEYDPENPISGLWAGRRHGNASYSWPRELFKPVSLQHKHDLNISGGDANTQYYASVGYFTEDGMYRYGYDYHNRYNALANLSTQATDWLNITINTRYAVTENDYPEGQTSAPRIRLIQEAATFAPMKPKYNINGTLQSPLIALLEGAGRNVTQRNDLWLTLAAEIEPLPKWKTNISYNYNKYTRTFDANPHPVWVEDGYGVMNNIGRPFTAYEREIDNDLYNMFNIVSSYVFALGRHDVSLMAGYEQEYKHNTNLFGRGDDLITQAVPSLSTALGLLQVNDAMSHWATQGVFGRLNYLFAEKYLLEFSARYQGSSRFASDQRWGFFPSGSLGYIVSNESFWAPIEPYVNRLKFRASYGSLGNQNVANYLYLSRIPVSTDQPWLMDDALTVTAGVPGLISNNLTWETITSFNLGMDAGFLDNRLDLVFDWYERKTTNMIGPSIVLPTLLGASAPQTNNAELLTRGFELVVSWKNSVSNDFAYNARLSLGDNKTTILKYENPEKLINTWYEGMVAGEIWGFTSDRLIQNDEDVENMPDQSYIFSRWGSGDMMYVDSSGDGKIDEGQRTVDDHGDLSIIGNTSPRYNIGILGGLNWKNLDFNMFWQGILSRQYYPSTGSTTIWGMLNSFGGSTILHNTDHLDYWRPADETNMFGPNTDAYFPKPYFSGETNKNRRVQSRYLQNAAYLRLKSLQIGYNLPSSVVNRAMIQKARIYLTGENLITIKAMPPLMDPETIVASEPQFGGYRSGIVYPLPRTFAIGVNLSF